VLEEDRYHPGDVLANDDEARSVVLQGFGFTVARLFGD
jgi:hypothetical protein